MKTTTIKIWAIITIAIVAVGIIVSTIYEITSYGFSGEIMYGLLRRILSSCYIATLIVFLFMMVWKTHERYQRIRKAAIGMCIANILVGAFAVYAQLVDVISLSEGGFDFMYIFDSLPAVVGTYMCGAVIFFVISCLCKVKIEEVKRIGD